MASNYSPELRIQLMQTGEKSGQWGDITNVNWELIESAISGSVNLSVTAGNNILTYADGSADESRCAILNITNAAGVFILWAPPVTKTYIIKNNTGVAGSIYCSTVIGNTTAAGAGYDIPANKTVFIHSNGTAFFDGVNHISQPLSLDVALGSNYGGTGYGTGASPYVVGDMLYANTTSSLAKIAISGSANRVLRSNGTTPSWGQVALTTDVTGVLPIANGGTNLSSTNAYGFLVSTTANTLSSVSVAAGESLKLNSTGTAWEAYTPSTGSGVTQIIAGTGLSGGTITTSGTIAIANTGVSAGTWGNATNVPQISVNAQGQIISVTNVPITSGGGGVTSISASSPLNASSSTGAVTLSINNASTGSAGVVTTGAQTFLGEKTFSSGLISQYQNFNGNSSNYYSGSFVYTSVDGGTKHAVGTSQAYYTFSDVQKVGGGSFNSFSDARYKQDISSYTKGLAEIKQVQPKNYRYTAEFMKSDEPSQAFVGVIAQEFENTAFSNCVRDNTDGYKIVDTSELTYALINAVKELSAKVEQLEAQLNAM